MEFIDFCKRKLSGLAEPVIFVNVQNEISIKDGKGSKVTDQ